MGIIQARFLRWTLLAGVSCALLSAQARVGASSAGRRVGRVPGVHSGNVVYPGTPSGARPGSIVSPGIPGGAARPGSILTPGTPRRIPATPGAIPGTPNPNSPQGVRRRGITRSGRPPRARLFEGRQDRVHRGFVPVYVPVYGYVYEYGGPDEVELQPNAEARGEPSSGRVVEAPPEVRREPRSRIYEVRDDPDGPDGAVEMVPQHGEQLDYWLIALKGGLIYAAERYWVQDETFRFTTLDGKQFVVSSAETDFELTKKLNADRGREFNPDAAGR